MGEGVAGTHPTVLIRPASRIALPDVGELWAHRELLLFLIWRDVAVRYKQTALGVLWAVLQPIGTMVVFSVFFGKLIRVSSDGVPYPVFSYCALLPWIYFANAMGASSYSLIGNANLITKMYFPRLIIPLAATLEGLIDFGLSFIVLIGLMLYYHVTPTLAVLWLPAFLLLAVAAALAVGLWLAAINVRYRDVRYTLPFLTQIWLFCTPVVYSSTLLPGRWRALFGINPMAGVIEGFRWALLGTAPPGPTLAVSVAIVALLLAGGLIYFQSTEHTFSDTI